MKTKFYQKVVLSALAVLMAVCVPMQIFNSPVMADKYDDQINALNAELELFNAEAARLSSQAESLSNALAILTNQKNELQALINLSQAKYDQLVAQIADTEKKIIATKDALGVTIANLYVEGQVTPVEMLFSSKNISEYMDKQEYRNSVRNELTIKIAEIKTLKAQLETEKASAEQVLAQQTAQRDTLAAKEAEQQSILNETRGQESAYQQLVVQKAANIASVRAQQAAALRALTNGGSNTAGATGSFRYRNYSGEQGCAGGYPWDEEGMSGYRYGCAYGLDEGPGGGLGVDKWQLYNRECVSYAAWAAYVRFGKYVTGFRGMGMAYEFANTAATYMGANVDNSPVVGDVAIAKIGPYGHAMVVEEVYGDGWIKISQFNFQTNGQYSTMDILASGAVYIHFRDR